MLRLLKRDQIKTDSLIGPDGGGSRTAPCGGCCLEAPSERRRCVYLLGTSHLHRRLSNGVNIDKDRRLKGAQTACRRCCGANATVGAAAPGREAER